jgi:hypothetical protein
MDDDRVQRSFAKYITIYIDTWKNQIFERYKVELPKKISKHMKDIEETEKHINETKTKNKGIKESIRGK